MTPSLSAVRPVEGRASARALAELTVQLHDLGSTAEIVDAIAQFAVRTVDCVQAAIVLQSEDGRAAIGGAGHAVPDELYRSQLTENDGPLVEAVRHGAIVHVARVRTEPRWPAWSARAAAAGLGGAIYAPLGLRNGAVGALVLSSLLDDGFSDADIATARALACHASVALTDARRHEQLSKATERRSLAGQAAGILMERYTLDADEAFAILHSHAAKRRLEVHTVAAELVATRRLGPRTWTETLPGGR